MDQHIFQNSQNICRLCLSIHRKLINIFNHQDLKSLKIQLSVEELCSIKLTDNDLLPKCICKNCMKKLFNIQKFISMCKDSDVKLQKIYEMQLKKNEQNMKLIKTNDVSIQTDITEMNQNLFIQKEKNISKVPYKLKKSLTKNPEYLKGLSDEEEIQIFNQNSLPEASKSDVTHRQHVTEQETLTNVLTMSKDVANSNKNSSFENGNINENNTQNLNGDVKELMFRNKKDKKEISESNDSKYLCDICSKTLQTESGLRLHLKMHTGLKPFKCKVCDKAFAIESYKKRHELTHSGNKLFMCHLCSASFASANGFKYHLMAHTGELKHSCEICGKSFIRYKYLKEHIFTHTGEKPYACKLCGVAYGNSGSLFVHEKKCKGQTKKQKRLKRSEANIVSNVYTSISDIQGRVILLKNDI